MSSLKPTEKDIVAQITQWLTYNRIFWQFCPNKGVYDTSKDDVTPGASDLIVIIKGLYVGIEVKAPGKKQSKDQKEFQRSVENAGSIYILAYSVDDVIPKIERIQKAKVILCPSDAVVM